MKYTIPFPIIVATLFLLPGCTRIVDWAKDSFYQGDKVSYDHSAPQEYIRSVTVYDQFYTRARFDVMWLSDSVRTAYAHVYDLKHGSVDSKSDSFLHKQLAKNNDYIVFYLLAPATYILGDPMSDWTLFLQIGDRSFEPVEVKEFNIEPEYRSFFGKLFNRFKVSYRITFQAQDSQGFPFVDENITMITLHARSFEKNIKFEWDLLGP